MHLLLSSSLCCGKELQDLKFPSKELQNYKKVGLVYSLVIEKSLPEL
jgi:hypothetical protein